MSTADAVPTPDVESKDSKDVKDVKRGEKRSADAEVSPCIWSGVDRWLADRVCWPKKYV
jgi:hypothetical protein